MSATTFVRIGQASIDAARVDGVVYEDCKVCGAHVYIKVLMQGGSKVFVEDVYSSEALDGPWNPNKATFYARVQQRVAEIALLLRPETQEQK